jgi:hypothetical protein
VAGGGRRVSSKRVDVHVATLTVPDRADGASSLDASLRSLMVATSHRRSPASTVSARPGGGNGPESLKGGTFPKSTWVVSVSLQECRAADDALARAPAAPHSTTARSGLAQTLAQRSAAGNHPVSVKSGVSGDRPLTPFFPLLAQALEVRSHISSRPTEMVTAKGGRVNLARGTGAQPISSAAPCCTVPIAVDELLPASSSDSTPAFSTRKASLQLTL